MYEFTDFNEGQEVLFLQNFPGHNIERGDIYTITEVYEEIVALSLKEGRRGIIGFQSFTQNGGDAATLCVGDPVELDEDTMQDLLGVKE